MGADEDSTLLPGQSPPLAALTATNQSGIVLIATSMGLIFALISVCIRLFIRREFRQHIFWDDFLSFASCAIFIAQSSVVFAQVSEGFGRTAAEISDEDMVSWQKIAFTSDVLYIFTMWMTKCSVAFLFIRLTADNKHLFASYTFLALATIFMALSVLLVSLRCDISQPWIFVDRKCDGLFARWQAVTAFDVSTEIFLFSISIFMLHGLQLRIWKKCIVVLAFGLRLPVIAPSILRNHYLGIELASSDASLNGVLAATFAQIELSYAIIATTTPCLRPFMSALNTHYGGPQETKTTPPGTKGSDDSGQSGQSGPWIPPIPLGSLPPRLPNHTSDKRGIDRSPVPQIRWDGAEYNVEVTSKAPRGDQISLDSSDSRKLIMKNTEWTVGFEEHQSSSQGQGSAV